MAFSGVSGTWWSTAAFASGAASSTIRLIRRQEVERDDMREASGKFFPDENGLDFLGAVRGLPRRSGERQEPGGIERVIAFRRLPDLSLVEVAVLVMDHVAIRRHQLPATEIAAE